MKINEILPLESQFTEVLGSIAIMPKMLYFYGKLPDFVQNRAKVVAIVGARRCTKYGAEIAYRAGYELAKRGAVVVSGLAYGIDSAAHRGAVDAGGVTVGVLGTAIDDIYPREHTGLARRIIESGGAVMSEFPEGSEEPGRLGKTMFLRRNRIISGLSDAVIVVEASVRSGSLNTAMHALEQGKDLWAVPGAITAPLSEGCNRLLKQGANALCSVDDLFAEWFPSGSSRRRKRVGSQEEGEILGLIEEGMRDGEEISGRLGISAAEFARTITIMEINGVVRSLGGNMWTYM
jgi:DNA processing protein